MQPSLSPQARPNAVLDTVTTLMQRKDPRARMHLPSVQSPRACSRVPRQPIADESAQYGLTLFQKLNLQLLIVTPLQKIHIIEPFVASVAFVQNEGGRSSKLRNLSIEEYRAHKAEFEQ
jgi:hypothetical protein